MRWVINDHSPMFPTTKYGWFAPEILPYPQNTNIVSPATFLSLSGVGTAPIGHRIVVVGDQGSRNMCKMGVAGVVDGCC